MFPSHYIMGRFHSLYCAIPMSAAQTLHVKERKKELNSHPFELVFIFIHIFYSFFLVGQKGTTSCLLLQIFRMWCSNRNGVDINEASSFIQWIFYLHFCMTNTLDTFADKVSFRKWPNLSLITNISAIIEFLSLVSEIWLLLTRWRSMLCYVPHNKEVDIHNFSSFC